MRINDRRIVDLNRQSRIGFDFIVYLELNLKLIILSVCDTPIGKFPS